MSAFDCNLHLISSSYTGLGIVKHSSELMILRYTISFHVDYKDRHSQKDKR